MKYKRIVPSLYSKLEMNQMFNSKFGTELNMLFNEKFDHLDYVEFIRVKFNYLHGCTVEKVRELLEKSS